MQTLSRRAPRYRFDVAAKAQPLLGGEIAVCRTKDVSAEGLCLDTAAWFPLGTRISVSLLPPRLCVILSFRQRITPGLSTG